MVSERQIGWFVYVVEGNIQRGVNVHGEIDEPMLGMNDAQICLNHAISFAYNYSHLLP